MYLFFAVMLLCLLVLSPYIIIAVKRARVLRRLSAAAKKSGFRVRRLHRFVCLSFNRAPRYDLLFESRERAFAVKLWSATNARGTLVINADGRAYERASLPPELDTEAERERIYTTRARRVPVTRSNFRIRQGKEIEYILLYAPQNKSAVLSNGKGHRALHNGERVFGKLLCTPKYFEEILLNIT